MKQLRIPAVYMRGGTSKGVFFDERSLPRDAKQREHLILSLMGSPDPRQIDALRACQPSHPRQRNLQVLMNIVAQRLERRNVKNLRVIGKLAYARLPDQRIQSHQKRG